MKHLLVLQDQGLFRLRPRTSGSVFWGWRKSREDRAARGKVRGEAWRKRKNGKGGEEPEQERRCMRAWRLHA